MSVNKQYLFAGTVCLAVLANDGATAAQTISWQSSQHSSPSVLFSGHTNDPGPPAEDQLSARLSLALLEAKEGGGPHTLWLTSTLNLLAQRYERQGRYEEADQALAHALAIDEKALGTRSVYVIRDLHNLAGLSYRRNKFGKAEGFVLRVILEMEALLNTDRPHDTTDIHELAIIWIGQENFGIGGDDPKNKLKNILKQQDPYNAILFVVIERYYSMLNVIREIRELE
jgi:tetratricopeptide (TPR) repeat protein